MSRTERITPDRLSAAVRDAVGLAAERQQITGELLTQFPFRGEAIRPPRWIFGRFVRDAVSLDAVNRFANEVTEHVAKSIGNEGLTPATLVIGDEILAGFIEPAVAGFELPGFRG